MLACFVTEREKALPIEIVLQKDYTNWVTKQTDLVQSWLGSTQFRGEAGNVSVVPDASGKASRVICCVNDLENLWGVGGLPLTLPQGQYYFDAIKDNRYQSFAIAWGLGAYQFTKYKKPTRKPAELYLPDTIQAQVSNIVESIYLARDLINTPTDDMGPSELAQITKDLAAQFGGTFSEITGEDLLKQNFPCIYTVGRASDDAPRLLDLRWGNAKNPKVTLVGKGVCFDTGGLDLKPSAYMLLMKKDMGGAAHVLALARMIMQAKLPIALRVLIPAVENAIAGNAYRPGDVIKSRKGLTIEVGNTDAEGRLVLADAITEAVSEKPDLLIDIATLTGAARIAVGTDLPAVFSNHDETVNAVLEAGLKQSDPMWRLPLFAPYRELINSQIADINNNSSDPYAGAITAGLFLKEFVPDDIPWLHYDLMAWNLRAKPGRPQGGEAGAIRALFAYLSEKYHA